MKWKESKARGESAESKFIDIIGDSFIRRADRKEDIHEHWDVLFELDGKETKVDIKGAKKNLRSDSQVDNDIHFWEFKNVAGKKGWGVPSEVERLIAFEVADGFILVNPSDIFEPLQKKCSEAGEGYGLFQCRGRSGRNDWFSKISVDFLKQYSCGFIC